VSVLLYCAVGAQSNLAAAAWKYDAQPSGQAARLAGAFSPPYHYGVCVYERQRDERQRECVCVFIVCVCVCVCMCECVRVISNKKKTRTMYVNEGMLYPHVYLYINI
jgi:hypothetical protein